MFSAHSGHPAYTIHRKIYRGAPGELSGGMTVMQRNSLSDAVFIVDDSAALAMGLLLYSPE